MHVIRWITSYAANADPRVAAANAVALVIVSNQPFYPVYLFFIVGSSAWVSLVSLLSTPLFFAVPALGRRSGVAGRALMILAGTGNTILCTKVLGEASSVDLFLLPCILLGPLLFRSSERLLMATFTALPMAALFLLRGRYGAHLLTFSPEEYRSMTTLHLFSVASLFAFIGYTVTNLMPRQAADAS